jgi:hypothetical protein
VPDADYRIWQGMFGWSRLYRFDAESLHSSSRAGPIFRGTTNKRRPGVAAHSLRAAPVATRVHHSGEYAEEMKSWLFQNSPDWVSTHS